LLLQCHENQRANIMIYDTVVNIQSQFFLVCFGNRQLIPKMTYDLIEQAQPEIAEYKLRASEASNVMLYFLLVRLKPILNPYRFGTCSFISMNNSTQEKRCSSSLCREWML
jgi:hypothetical protein